MSSLFHTILYQPLLNILVFFYNIIPGHDFGVAIILLTILVRLILWPLAGKGIAGQKAMSSLQPKIAELKTKYKDNKQELARATMALYKNEKINPLSSCIPMSNVPKEIKKVTDFIWELPTSYKKGMNVPARIYASKILLDAMDDGVFNQVTNVACLPGIQKYAFCMPDGHWGYGFPIGGVAAFDADEGVISPGGN